MKIEYVISEPTMGVVFFYGTLTEARKIGGNSATIERYNAKNILHEAAFIMANPNSFIRDNA